MSETEWLRVLGGKIEIFHKPFCCCSDENGNRKTRAAGEWCAWARAWAWFFFDVAERLQFLILYLFLKFVFRWCFLFRPNITAESQTTAYLIPPSPPPPNTLLTPIAESSEGTSKVTILNFFFLSHGILYLHHIQVSCRLPVNQYPGLATVCFLLTVRHPLSALITLLRSSEQVRPGTGAGGPHSVFTEKFSRLLGPKSFLSFPLRRTQIFRKNIEATSSKEWHWILKDFLAATKLLPMTLKKINFVFSSTSFPQKKFRLNLRDISWY